MLASQQFCVKWNSYSTNLQNVFPRLLTSEHFVDITLACEGQMIKCHKVVLSACSTYFEKLLVQNPCQHPIIFMKDMKHWEVQALVDFMYKGEVNVSQDELSSLLVAAEALQIRGLCGSDHMGRGTALPQDTVLSGSGRESPASKRKRVDDSPQTSSRPSCQSTSTTKLSNSDSDIVTSLEQTQDENCEITETEMPERKPIKQEVDIDENFGDDGLENDRSEEHYANHEAQDDSDSKEQPQSPRDQPGPSGLPPNQTLTADKAATDLGAAMALQNVMCVLSGSPTNSGKVMPFGFSDGKDLHPSIPSPSTRIRRSEEELQKAAECVQKGMTFQNVSDIFNIPISTIRFYMARRGILPQRRRGRVSHSGQSSLQSNQTQPPSYMLLHYKLPDIGATKRTN